MPNHTLISNGEKITSYKHFIYGAYISRSRFRNVIRELNFDIKKSIMIHPHVFYDDEYLKITIDYIIKKLSKLGYDSKIIFFHPDEGYSINNLIFYDKVVKHLIQYLNISQQNLFYVTAASGTSINKERYYKYCKEFDFVPMNVIFISTFESNHYVDGSPDTWFIYNQNNPIKYADRVIEKKFVCLNGRPRPHRLAIVSEIIKRSLLKDCFLSFSLRDDELPITHQLGPLETFFPQTSDVISKIITENSYLFPLFLTMKEPDGDNMHCPNKDDIKMYRSSFFSLVNETVFFTSKQIYGDHFNKDVIMCFPCTFFSEKTWNCIKVKHPFILCHTPFALDSLRELGYKTFSPFIDESYDLIEDDYARISAIMNEVERLCNMNDAEMKEWIKGTTEICEYNYEVFINKKRPIIDIEYLRT